MSSEQKPTIYRVGYALDPQPTDPYFYNIHDAIKAGAFKAKAEGVRAGIAVFDEFGDVVRLFYAGQRFARL